MRAPWNLTKELHSQGLSCSRRIACFHAKDWNPTCTQDICEYRQKRRGKRFLAVLAEIASQKLGRPPHQASDFLLCASVCSPEAAQLRLFRVLKLQGFDCLGYWIFQGLDRWPCRLEILLTLGCSRWGPALSSSPQPRSPHQAPRRSLPRSHLGN